SPRERVHIFVDDATGHTWNYSTDITASDTGTFFVQFQIASTFISNYIATATGWMSEIVTTTFTDTGVDFSQCANDDSPFVLGQCHWISSILQASDSRYFEGMSVPQRVVFTGIPATTGDNHELTFHVQATKGSIHAYDFLTSYEQAIRAAADATVPYT